MPSKTCRYCPKNTSTCAALATTTDLKKEHQNAAQPDTRQATNPAPARHDQGAWRTTRNARHQRSQLRRTPWPDGRPRADRARRCTPDDSPQSRTTTPQHLPGRHRLPQPAWPGQGADPATGQRPVAARRPEPDHRRPNRRRQNLARLRAGPQGLPRRLQRALSAPAALDGRAGPSPRRWALRETDGGLCQDRLADPG
ncbi:hypothetical protein D3C78_1254430 [compost metagenome]